MYFLKTILKMGDTRLRAVEGLGGEGAAVKDEEDLEIESSGVWSSSNYLCIYKT